MANIGIVYEPTMADAADALAQIQRQNGHSIKLICRDKFPIADAMFWFLANLSSNFSEAFILISGLADSNLSTWISKELCMQHGMGNFATVRPVFATADAVQPWWKNQTGFIVMSTDLD